MDRLNELEKRIQELERKLNQSNNMFGRCYSQAGSSGQDFLIKTKGQVKIQYGNKFIDLIKNGKINVDSKFIFYASTKDSIGVKEGIYYIEEDGSVYLKIASDDPILIANTDSNYVAYTEQTPSDQERQQVLINLGIVCDSSSIPQLQNGFIYVTDEDQFYIVKEGELTKLKTEISNPLTIQLVIDQNQNFGSLVLKNTGKNSGINFGNSWLYEEEGIKLESSSSIQFYIGPNRVLKIDSTELEMESISVNSIKSSNFSIDENGNIQCNSIQTKISEQNNEVSNELIYFYKALILESTNISEQPDEEWDEDQDESEVEEVEPEPEPEEEQDAIYHLIINSEEFQIGDIIAVLSGNNKYVGEIIEEPESEPEPEPEPEESDEESDENEEWEDDEVSTEITTSIYVKFKGSPKDILNNKYIYVIQRGTQQALTIKNNSLNLGGFFIGYDENNNLIAKYPDDYEFPPLTNDSQNLASIKWINTLFPSGIIMLLEKTKDIPEGWSEYNDNELIFTNLKTIIKN